MRSSPRSWSVNGDVEESNTECHPPCEDEGGEEPFACIGLKPEGVDFNSLDGQPSRIFIMTLSPIDRVGPHVQFLAEVSMVIKTEEARAKILQAKTAQEVLAVFGA